MTAAFSQIENACKCHTDNLTWCLHQQLVLNLLRLGDQLQILSLSRGPTLEIVPWKISKIDPFVCLDPQKIKR